MPAKELHIGDAGTIIELELLDDTTPVNIATATTLEIILQPPKGAKKTKTAVLSGNGSDGKLRYVTQSGDLDSAGRWRVQARIAGAAFDQKSQVLEFDVAYNL